MPQPQTRDSVWRGTDESKFYNVRLSGEKGSENVSNHVAFVNLSRHVSRVLPHLLVSVLPLKVCSPFFGV